PGHCAGRFRDSIARVSERLEGGLLWCLCAARGDVREISSARSGGDLREGSAAARTRLRLWLPLANRTRASHAGDAPLGFKATFETSSTPLSASSRPARERGRPKRRRDREVS